MPARRNVSRAIISDTVYLERLNKGIEENSDADTSPKQFDQPRRSEQFEKPDLDQLRHVDDASHHRDEVKDVPRLTEVVLKENCIRFEHNIASV